MENSMLNNLPIDPLIIIAGFSVLSLVLLVVVIICIVKMNKLYRRYDLFMRGKDAETLEDAIISILEELNELNVKDRGSKDMMKQLSKQVKSSFQKFGFVKYNAFKGMGGNLSFVIAMLDDNNSGFILDAVHSREGCYLYLKEVEEGATEVLLGGEEQEALEHPTLSERLSSNVRQAGEGKEKSGSGEQSIEIPNSERKKSERMKELRRRQREAELAAESRRPSRDYGEDEADFAAEEDENIKGEY